MDSLAQDWYSSAAFDEFGDDEVSGSGHLA
jgi:hypothetical protein